MKSGFLTSSADCQRSRRSHQLPCQIEARLPDSIAVIGSKGKYRVRTWLRVHAPRSIARRATKGTHDCGNHEWYRSEEEIWRCYYCEVGRLVRHEISES